MLDNARTIEMTWNSGETIFPVRVEKNQTTSDTSIKMIPVYSFMDNETFEQITVAETMIDAPSS